MGFGHDRPPEAEAAEGATGVEICTRMVSISETRFSTRSSNASSSSSGIGFGANAVSQILGKVLGLIANNRSLIPAFDHRRRLLVIQHPEI